MTTYTNTFGNDTVPPSQYGYQALSITSNTTLEWPYNSTGGSVTSKLIDLTATAGLSLTLPDATQVSTGEDVLIRNVGAETVTVKDNGGGTIGTITAGAAKYFYLTSNATAAGTWGLIAYGVGTSSVDAATLVGYGLMASGVTLNQASPLVTDADPTVTVDATYRAKTLVLTGGATTVALTAAATLGDNFFLFLRNGGTGTATIDPDGAELIDGTSTLGIQPGESLMLVCSGTAWYSVGYGRAVLYQFSQLVKDVSVAGSFTLTASEASNKLLTFTGNPAGAVTIVVPNTVAVYYTQSSISTAQTIAVKTAAGTGASVTQSQRIIMICDGTNVVAAQSAAATSAVSYPAGSAAAPSINFSASTNTGIFLKGATGVGLSANGTEIGSFETTGLELVSPLAVTEGGTGRVTSTTAYGLLAAGTTATGVQQTLPAGATTEILVGGGAAALPAWTAATGTGAPVRANAPTLITPVLGVATATSLSTTGTVYVGTNSVAGFGSSKFQVAGTSEAVTASIVRYNIGGTAANLFIGTSKGASVGTPGAISAGGGLGSILFSGDDGAGMQNGAQITAVSETVGSGSITAYLSFRTTTSGTSPSEKLKITAAGSVLVTGTGGGALGYGAGAGGAVTQATSKATGVTLDKPTGQITMHNANLAAGAGVTFLLSNSLIAATDTIIVHRGGSAGSVGAYVCTADGVAAGSCTITVRNMSAGDLAEAVVLNFAVIKGVAS